MSKETLGRWLGPVRRYLPYRNQRHALDYLSDSRCNSDVRRLAQPARRFIVPVRVAVGRNLHQKYQRDKRQCYRQCSGEPSSGFLSFRLHLPASR